MDSQKNTGNVIGGHKANLNNSNTSEDSKEQSRQFLEENGSETRSSSGANGSESMDGKNPNNFIGGHKANLKNPKTSQEAKEHSKAVLDEHDADY